MKRILLACLVLIAVAATVSMAVAQGRRPDPSTMSAYILGIYTKGPLWSAAHTPHADSIQAGHLANIQKMADAGALLGAGPFAGNSKIRGLLIFKDLPMESVHALVLKDPALKAEQLLLELHRWYAPRGIGEAYQARARLRPANRDSMIMLPVAFLMRPAKPVTGDSLASAAAMAGHMGHILDTMMSGQALAAGPVFDDGQLRGISVFGTDTTTARKLANEDPAVKAGRLQITVLPWWTAWGVMPPTPKVKEMRR